MMRKIACLFLALVLPAGGAEEMPPDVAKAKQALAIGIPEVAASKLAAWIDASPGSPYRDPVRSLLVDALLIAGDIGGAEQRAAELDPGSPAAAMAAGRIAAARHQWPEAAEWFRKAADGESLAPQALAALAYCLERTGNPEAAANALTRAGTVTQTGADPLLADLWVTLGDPARALGILEGQEGNRVAWVRARALHALGRFDEVPAILQPVMDSGPGAGPELLAAARILAARSLEASGDAAAAAAVLQSAIEAYPAAPTLGLLFEELDAVAMRNAIDLEPALLQWTKEDGDARQEPALRFAGIARMRSGHCEEAVDLLEAWLAATTSSDQNTGGKLALIAAYLCVNRTAEANNLLNTLDPEAIDVQSRARRTFLEGQTAFALGDYEAASESFREGFETSTDTETRKVALFNLAAVFTAAGEYENFLEIYKEFSALYPESERRRELVLEEGLLKARNGDPQAVETLSVFVRDFGDHPRVTEAMLALAELAHHTTPPDTEGALVWLSEIETVEAPPAVREAAEFLRFFILAGSGVPVSELSSAVEAFKQKFPESTRLPHVLMKLGELHFEAEDFLAAESVFYRSARGAPPPLPERGFFLAGLSAVRTMNPDAQDRALEFFETAARYNGALLQYARLEQARIKMRQGAYSEAILLCRSAMESDPAPPLRFELMMATGESAAAAADEDTTAALAAAEEFLELAREPEITPRWRNQALWKAAQIFARTGDRERALLAYYEAFAEDPAREAVPDYFWFYKAAFDAGHLLEEDGRVESAAGIYRRLANLPGPRAGEAAQRLNRLRLDHFLWEE